MPEDFLAQGISSIIVIIIAIFLFLFWITMITDWTRRSFNNKAQKVWWFLALIFLQTLGAFVYWLTIRRTDKV